MSAIFLCYVQYRIGTQYAVDLNLTLVDRVNSLALIKRLYVSKIIIADLLLVHLGVQTT